MLPFLLCAQIGAFLSAPERLLISADDEAFGRAIVRSANQHVVGSVELLPPGTVAPPRVLRLLVHSDGTERLTLVLSRGAKLSVARIIRIAGSHGFFDRAEVVALVIDDMRARLNEQLDRAHAVSAPPRPASVATSAPQPSAAGQPGAPEPAGSERLSPASPSLPDTDDPADSDMILDPVPNPALSELNPVTTAPHLRTAPASLTLSPLPREITLLMGKRWRIGVGVSLEVLGLAVSASRPCPGGQLCDPETSRCLDGPDLGTDSDADVTPDLVVPECAGNCLMCQQHGDCPSLVCDDYLRSGSSGTCVPTADVLYVDNRNGTCGSSGTGDTPATAKCTVAEALLRIDGVNKRVIRVMASTHDYGTLAITGQSVAIFGPAGQGGSAQFQGGGIVDALAVSGTATVVLNGMDITRGKVGLLCQGSGATSVTLRHGSLTSCSDIGLLISNCNLELDRILIADNSNGALAIGGSQSYLVTNSYIVHNHSLALPAIKLSSSGQGTFRFSTVADNDSEVAAGIECSGPGVMISDSIVFRNSQSGNSQLQNCQLWTTAVGRTDGAVMGIREDPTFTSVSGIDYALDSNVMNNSCCVDRATNSAPVDYFGNLRPRGKACDIGAHEAR